MGMFLYQAGMGSAAFIICASVPFFLVGSLLADDQVISLKAEALAATAQVPGEWGKGIPFTQADAENSGVFLRLPDASMKYSGVLWKGLAPKEDFSDSGPLLTISLVPIPARFEHDEGSRLPENDRPERVLTKEQKLEVFRAPYEDPWRFSRGCGAFPRRRS
jgi:hypothetical protein